ncbi:hypothetical protein WN48_00304 [Eufriesea mexicana]|uniref:Mab-21-like HhH/H2TH-like domain-containing protein n=1 Tax=Eufriesea mexicana TaxID=516756 RepID=A0A310S867_9HYME|nr:hypothetical protein WN48_00304 [Eufriesea mexicana]
MKLNDSLFEKMYEKNIYCGSFYKLTKIEKPNEFDLNIILKLPVNYNYIQCRNDMWFAIPIQLYNNLDYIKFEKDIYWRISFSLQENEILRKYGNIKTVIRQMKKFRDIQGLKNIASYYIENLFLNKETDINMDKISRTLLLFKMLEELYYACERQEIKWFWNEKYNLLSKIGKSNLYNISQRLKNIINDIKNNFMDQFIIAKYICKLD